MVRLGENRDHSVLKRSPIVATEAPKPIEYILAAMQVMGAVLNYKGMLAHELASPWLN